jgi:hypothetical protein
MNDRKPGTVQAIARTVYHSPRASRCFMTLRAACNAEARAILKAKYPNEGPEYHDGHMTYPGFSWHALPRSDVLYRRLARKVRAAYEAGRSLP